MLLVVIMAALLELGGIKEGCTRFNRTKPSNCGIDKYKA
jgi:hypothetical protein